MSVTGFQLQLKAAFEIQDYSRSLEGQIRKFMDVACIPLMVNARNACPHPTSLCTIARDTSDCFASRFSQSKHIFEPDPL